MDMSPLMCEDVSGTINYNWFYIGGGFFKKRKIYMTCTYSECCILHFVYFVDALCLY